MKILNFLLNKLTQASLLQTRFVSEETVKKKHGRYESGIALFVAFLKSDGGAEISRGMARSWSKLALNARSATIREEGMGAVRAIAQNAKNPEITEFLAGTLEQGLNDPVGMVRFRAASGLSHLALFRKLADPTSAAKALAGLMGDSDPVVREYATIDLCQNYHNVIRSLDDWKTSLSGIFAQAAARNGLSAEQVAAQTRQVEGTVAFWQERVAAAQAKSAAPEPPQHPQ